MSEVDRMETGLSETEKLVREHLGRIKALPIVVQILTRLSKELSPDLCYHSVEHTEEVLKEVIRYGVIDGLTNREIELLGIAAAYHDAGFLVARTQNEAIAADFVATAMKTTGVYTDEDIQLVVTLILDTRVVETRTGPQQIPSCALSRYLLDADMSNLGRNDFFEKNELHRQEVRYGEDIALQKSLELLNNHNWHTSAARDLRSEVKKENIIRVKERLSVLKETNENVRYLGVSLDNLGFLTRLPLLLTSAYDVRTIVDRCLQELSLRVEAQASTVFLLEEGADELTFWALSGESSGELQGKRMPKNAGIVGWVIQHGESVLVKEVASDPRFFGRIDSEGGFHTKDVICVPLRVRGSSVIGAIQVLNSVRHGGFLEEDMIFIEHVAHQLSMAIDNSRLYANLVKRTKQLALLDQRKNETLTLIAHEFRTPLNVIQSSAEMLSSGVVKDEVTQQKISEALKSGISRLSKLIGEVRRVTHVSDSTLEVKSSSVDLNVLFDVLYGQYQVALAQRNLTMVREIQNDLPNVRADAALIAVVIGNLISNAIRFTPDGGLIELGAKASAGLVEVSVRDTGIGIEEKQLDAIFDKFYEVGDILEHSSGSFEFKSGGLGLGLPTVKAILDAHNAPIEVTSMVGSGSRFCFRLPVVL